MGFKRRAPAQQSHAARQPSFDDTSTATSMTFHFTVCVCMLQISHHLPDVNALHRIDDFELISAQHSVRMNKNPIDTHLGRRA